MGRLYSTCWPVFPLNLKTSFSRGIFFIVHRLRYHSPTNLSSPGKTNNWKVVKCQGLRGICKMVVMYTQQWWKQTHSTGDTDNSYGEHIHIAIADRPTVMVDTDTQQSQTEWLFRAPENITITYWQIIVYWWVNKKFRTKYRSRSIQFPK